MPSEPIYAPPAGGVPLAPPAGGTIYQPPAAARRYTTGRRIHLSAAASDVAFDVCRAVERWFAAVFPAAFGRVRGKSTLSWDSQTRPILL